MKNIVVFDLDGTLVESKTPLSSEMSELLSKLLGVKKVVIITGGSYNAFQKQLLPSLKCSEELLENLFIFPTCGTSFYIYDLDGGLGEWKMIYSHDLGVDEKEKIMNGFDKMFEELDYKHPEEVYGEIIEDRGTQVTFSAHGQEAPLEVKGKWDPDQKKRLVMREALSKHIPGFDIKIGGASSLDITKKGIDKAYGMEQIMKHLNVEKDEIVFVGDALFDGGNDYPVKVMGIDCIEVSGPNDSAEFIRKILKESEEN